MDKSKSSFVLSLIFFCLLLWLLYTRVVFNYVFQNIFNESVFTFITFSIVKFFNLNEIKIKIVCLSLILFLYSHYKKYDKKKYNLNNLYIKASFLFVISFMPVGFFIKLPYQIGIPVLSASFPILIYYTLIIKTSIYSRKIDKDQFNLENQVFMQETEEINTDDSLNFGYKFKYNNKVHNGHINLVEIFRSVWIYGIMGSGKTFSFFYPAIYQLIKKGFTLAIYDYKFPSLTKKTYNYVKALKPKAELFFLCLTDMRYSHKCNPLEPKYIPTEVDIKNVAKTIMANLAEGKREHPFFDGSATGVFSALIAIQKKMEFKYNKQLSSLPHALILASVKIKYLIPILLSDKETLIYITSLRDAYDDSAATETLVGQTATLQLKLSDLYNPDFMYIASGKSDFSLDLNDPNYNKILTIGGSQDKAEAISPFTSLYFEIIAKRTNRPGRTKFIKVIDEFAQLYYKSFKNYLEVGRENLCGVIAGMQGTLQLYRKRSKEEADSILDIQGAVITGQAGKHTAQMVSDKIGLTNQHKVSVGSDSSSVNHSFYEAPVIPVSKISNFSTGDFCGVLVDSTENKISQKRFMGTISEHKESTGIKTDLDIPKIYTFENDKTKGIYNSHLVELDNIRFYETYKNVLLTNNFGDLTNDALFYMNFLEVDDDRLQSEHNKVNDLMSCKPKKKKNIFLIWEKEDISEEFDIDNYVKNFVQTNLHKKILDLEKKFFLDQYIDNLYIEVEDWVRKEYKLITGNEINDSLFKLDNFNQETHDNLEF